jgi:hypothetical protein
LKQFLGWKNIDPERKVGIRERKYRKFRKNTNHLVKIVVEGEVERFQDE